MIVIPVDTPHSSHCPFQNDIAISLHRYIFAFRFVEEIKGFEEFFFFIFCIRNLNFKRNWDAWLVDWLPFTNFDKYTCVQVFKNLCVRVCVKMDNLQLNCSYVVPIKCGYSECNSIFEWFNLNVNVSYGLWCCFGIYCSIFLVKGKKISSEFIDIRHKPNWPCIIWINWPLHYRRYSILKSNWYLM